DSHGAGRQLQELGELVAQEAVALGRRPDGDAFTLRGYLDDVGLDESLVRAGHGVAAFDDRLRGGQAGGDVAPLPPRNRAHVAGLLPGLGLGIAATAVDGDVVEAFGALLQDLRRRVLHRLERVDDRGQLLVVDADERGRV